MINGDILCLFLSVNDTQSKHYVSIKVQGCFKGSTMMLKAAGMFQEGLKVASRMINECSKIAEEKSIQHSAVLNSA